MADAPGDVPGAIPRALNGLAHLALAGIALGLACFAHPQIDDYWRAWRVRQRGVIGATSLEYSTWSGRWSGTGASYLTSSLIDLRYAYPFCLIAITLLYAAAIAVLVRGTMGAGLSRRMAWCLGASLLVLYWAEMPLPGETFYWFTGGLENHLGPASVMLLVGWLAGLPDAAEPRATRAVRLLALAAVAFVFPAIHELYGLFGIIVLAVGAAVAFRVGHGRRLEWSVVALMAVAGFVSVSVAPGNAARMDAVPESRSVSKTIELVLMQVKPAARDWLSLPSLLAGTLLFVVHPRIRAIRPGWVDWPGVPWRWLIPAVWLLLLAGGFAAPGWATGYTMAPRTLDALFMTFLVGWFATVFIWTRWPTAGAGEAPSLDRLASAAMVFYAIALVLLSQNARLGLKDLLVRAPAYDRAMRQRYDLLEEAVARGETEVHLPGLPGEPYLFFHADVVNDPEHWRNYHVKNYYGLETLTIETEVDPPPYPP